MHPGQYSAENRIIGPILRDMRLGQGLRQVDVAERLECHQSYVSKYESGEKSFKVAEVYVICTRGLGLSFQDFVTQYLGRVES